MNDRRAPLQMAAPGDSVPKIPFRTFLLRAHLLRILWGFPHIFGEIVFSAIMIIAVSKALKHRS